MTLFANYPSLKNRHVFITGGANGIGAAMVQQFCVQGSCVTFVDIDRDKAQQLVTSIQQQKLPIPLFLHCDLCDISALKKAVQAAEQVSGNIQVLVNNAASDERHQTLTLTEERWRQIFQINLDHQFFAAQAVIPGMIRSGGGAIINFSSNCFILGQSDDYIGYNTAKSAIIGLTRSLGREFGQYHIRVNALLPGWVMTDKQVNKWLTPEAERELIKGQALKEKLHPDDIARVALFLASDDSRMCSQQTFIVDAGRV